MIKPTIENLQKAQQINTSQIAALKPSGAFGQAVKYAVTEAHRYTLAITHVITGGLRASHRMKIDGLRGEIYIDPNAVNNVRKGARPSIYGPKEHARGGTHAFYARTKAEAGDRIAANAAKIVKDAL